MSEKAEQIAYSRIKAAIYKQYIRQGSRLAEAFLTKLSGNEVLYEQIEGLLQKCRIYLILFDTYDQIDFKPSPLASHLEHEEIIAHLSKGDSPGAEAAMRNHLNSTLDGMDFDTVLPNDRITI